MSIRVSGLVSGLDTDSMVQELVSAYSMKKDKYVKKQTKLDWKMDVWKDLNKKINSFYKKLGNLKLSSGYTQKTTTCSDTTKATVSAGSTAINGTQSLIIEKTAKSAYITGAKLDSSITAKTKLSELGLSGEASIAVKTKSGTKNIVLKDNMTVKEAAAALQGGGVDVNYDETNKRMFVSAKESGVENEFALTATDENGVKALQALGIYVDKSSNSDAYKEWTNYAVDASGNPAYDANGNLVGVVDEAKTKANLTAILENIAKYQAGADESSSIKALQQDSANRKTENTNLLNKVNYANSYSTLKEWLKSTTTDADGNEVSKLSTDEQDELFELMTMSGDMTDAQKTRMDELKGKLDVRDADWKMMQKSAFNVKSFETFLLNDTLTNEERVELQGVQDAVHAAYETGNGAEDIKGLIGEAKVNADGTTTYTGWAGKMAENNDQITANTEEIIEKNNYIKSYALLTGAAPESDGITIADRVDALMSKINFAADQLTNAPVGGYSAAKLVEAQDTEIELNGVKYTSSTNNITVNGLSITALQETNGQAISITTSANAQGMYDTIKGCLKQYNELIKEMDTLYNAASAKGYEPLTDDEKAEMSDKEVEKWEEKIKDSILRRDDRLSTVMNSMTMAMSKSFKLSNGSSYSLSSFGIKTQGYLAAEENEGYLLHIDGDSEDELVSSQKDKLMTAIQNDPDSVQEFFQQLTGNLYDDLYKKMGTSTTNHSILTIYNDKTMQKEYDDYSKTIKKWEEKVSDMEEYYYNKFSAMETALSKLQNSTSALSGLLGGS